MSGVGSEPAYPCQPLDRCGNPACEFQAGLTKREAIAASLMPAVVAAYIEANGRCLGTEHVAYNTAAHAVRLADALLVELAKVPA